MQLSLTPHLKHLGTSSCGSVTPHLKHLGTCSSRCKSSCLHSLHAILHVTKSLAVII